MDGRTNCGSYRGTGPSAKNGSLWLDSVLCSKRTPTEQEEQLQDVANFVTGLVDELHRGVICARFSLLYKSTNSTFHGMRKLVYHGCGFHKVHFVTHGNQTGPSSMHWYMYIHISVHREDEMTADCPHKEN